MRKRKVVLVLLAVACVYIVAAGGLSPLVRSREHSLAVLLRPLLNLRPFDAGLLMMSVIFLLWALLLGKPGTGIRRTTLLQAVAFGSALLTAIFLGAAQLQFPRPPMVEMTGVIAVMALLQGFVGFTASFLLACRRESMRTAPVPLAVNGTLTGLAVAMVCLPLIHHHGG